MLVSYIKCSVQQIAQRDQETHAAIEDVELQTLELQALRARLERELSQRQEEALYQLRSQHNAYMRTEGLTSSETTSGSQEEEEQGQEKIQEAQARLARAQVDRSFREAEKVSRLQREVDCLHQQLQQSKVNLTSLSVFGMFVMDLVCYVPALFSVIAFS